MKKYKRIYLPIIFIFIAGIAYIALRAKQPDKNLINFVIPQLKKIETHIFDFSEQKAKIRIDATVYNPSPMNINIDSIYYTVSLEGKDIAQSKYDTPLRIAAKENTMLSFPADIKFKNLKPLLYQMESEKKDSANFHLKARVFVNNSFIPKKQFDIEFDQKVQLISTLLP
ncbi:MAG: LEA type 2 family protein [Bacteroidota bacterium]|nr:LEA type 2 family protein [Bacteroidota bacterium]MDP4191503.1 LEA type 2 family protein [Bacteroidota bacterium]MDP4196185.1 LEA type 2 family protein [Bacteroidota bacterium]